VSGGSHFKNNKESDVGVAGRSDKYKILIWKPEEKRSFTKPRRRREDNIGLDLREIGSESVDGLGPVAGCCEHGNEPSGSIRGDFLTT
jgi:hypothetical protein